MGGACVLLNICWEMLLTHVLHNPFLHKPGTMSIFCRDTTIINHSPCHSSNNSFNEDLPVADYRNQEMENRCVY